MLSVIVFRAAVKFDSGAAVKVRPRQGKKKSGSSRINGVNKVNILVFFAGLSSHTHTDYGSCGIIDGTEYGRESG